MRTKEEIIKEWEKSMFPSTHLILEVCLDIRELLLKKKEKAK